MPNHVGRTVFSSAAAWAFSWDRLSANYTAQRGEVFIGASDECDEVESGIGIRAMGLYGGTLGAIGAGVGYLIKRESWVRVSLSGNDIDISPVAALLSAEEGPRLALGVRVRF